MSEIVTLDPAAVADARTEVDITDFIKWDGVDYGDAAIEAYMADAARGQIPVDYRIPNRTITIPLNLRDQGAISYADIRRQIQAKAALFQREGGWLKREVAGTPWYADVVNATLSLGGGGLTQRIDLPIDTDAVLTLDCVPDFYGDEITLDLMTGTGEIVGVLQQSGVNAVIAGDSTARVRIVVTDGSGQTQLGLLWGVRSRHYDVDAPLVLEVGPDTGSVAIEGTGTFAALAGASGGSVITQTSLGTDWTAIAGDNGWTHVGTYRIFARVYSTVEGTQVRLVWTRGHDLARGTENAAGTIPAGSEFFLIDLGQVTLARSPLGVVQWRATIEAKSPSPGGDMSIDKLWLLPLDEFAGVIAAPPAEGTDTPYVIYQDLAAELRTDGVYHASAVFSDQYLATQGVLGDLPRLPPAGLEARPVELLVKPSRGDFDTQPDSGIDDLTAQVFYRPSWLTVPAT